MHSDFPGLFFIPCGHLHRFGSLEVTRSMHHTAVSPKGFARQHLGAIFLTCAFVFGFLAGTVVVSLDPGTFVSLVHEAIIFPVSFIDLLVHIIVPFSLTALILRTRRVELFLVLCFAQAFSFGIVSYSIYLAYGSVQWMIQALLLFTRTITLVLLLWFWCRQFSDRSQADFQDLILCFSVSVLVSVFDYCLISPLLAKLFIH